MVIFMNTRLTKENWLMHGFETLATHGHSALKADRMCKNLNVSRGSFYWHFSDIKDFREQLSDRWYAMVTEDVITQIDQSTQGRDRLARLMQTAIMSDARLERAVRRWAAENPQVAVKVDETDSRRLAYIKTILRDGGMDEGLIAPRARLVYCTYLGDATLGDDVAPAFDADDLTALAQLILDC